MPSQRRFQINLFFAKIFVQQKSGAMAHLASIESASEFWALNFKRAQRFV